MKTHHYLFYILFFIGHGLLISQNHEKVKKVAFIIVDGIAADMIENTPTPNLDRIAEKGMYTRSFVGGKKGTYSESPTISAVGYNSLLTGTWVNKHNVFGNEIKDPNYHYPTIFRLLKDYSPDKKTAVFSTWTENRTKLIGENLPETEYLKLDYSVDGLELDTVNYPHDEERNFIKQIDATIAGKATEYITKHGPALSWTYLEYTDDMGHKYGDSPQLEKAIKYEDSLIGQIWKAIEYRQKNYEEEWLFIITTDHGRHIENGFNHGGQSPRERTTWIISNLGPESELSPYYQPAITDILPTMVSFLEIPVDKSIKYEWDGVSWIDPIDFTDLTVVRSENKIRLNWKNLVSNPGEKIKIFISPTNNYKSGGEDSYQLLGVADVQDESYTFELKEPVSDFYKIILKTNNTIRNIWVTPENND